MEGLAHLGTFGFWIFVAAVVVAGIWFDARKRESQQETLRRIVESGKEIDAAVLDKLLSAGRDDTRPDQGLKVAGLIVMFCAPGLIGMGWFLSKSNEGIMNVMLGVSLLLAFVGVGLYVAGMFSARWYREEQSDNKG